MEKPYIFSFFALQPTQYSLIQLYSFTHRQYIFEGKVSFFLILLSKRNFFFMPFVFHTNLCQNYFVTK